MIKAYVGTFARFDLAIGAVDSLRRNIIGGADVQILAMSGCQADLPGYPVIAYPMPKWFGHMLASARSRAEPYIYIDDDVRLIEPVDLAARYGADVFAMPIAGHMMAYRAGLHNTVTHPLPVIRGGGSIAWPELREAAEASQCELIDDIWLHIDKGHEDETEARRRVIELVDNPLP